MPIRIVAAPLAASAIFVAVFAAVAAQGTPQDQPPAQPPPAPPTQEGAPAGRGQGQGRGRGVFPAQQRAPGDAALIERGKSLYSATCSACHGVDARGGQLGGPNLLRSQLVLSDQAGELIGPVVKGSRAERGMPPIPMPDEDIKAVAEYLHSLLAAARPQGAPPPSEAPLPDPIVGDAKAGEKYFAAKCSSCHSPTGDLNGIATRLADGRTLQVAWVAGGGGGGRAGGRGGGAPAGRSTTVVVTTPSGQTIEGRLVQIDHFLVTLMLPDDTIRTVPRDDRTKVQINDPLAAHRELLPNLTDKDMHDVTAFLSTLK